VQVALENPRVAHDIPYFLHVIYRPKDVKDVKTYKTCGSEDYKAVGIGKDV